MKKKLTISDLQKEASRFCEKISVEKIKELYGATDGKAVGTYIEHRFRDFLGEKHEFERGSSANGIDFPSIEINTDVKATSIKQPQSSSPFRSIHQKVYGLGYNLLLFVYEKADLTDTGGNYSNVKIVSCAFISKERTGDYQLTKAIIEAVKNKCTKKEIIRLFELKNLPDKATHEEIAEEVMKHTPLQGYVTISNALQWRLQYSRIVEMKSTDGVNKIL